MTTKIKPFVHTPKTSVNLFPGEYTKVKKGIFTKNEVSYIIVRETLYTVCERKDTKTHGKESF